MGVAKHDRNGGPELAASACTVAALTDSDHHQDRICKHVRDLKRRSGL